MAMLLFSALESLAHAATEAMPFAGAPADLPLGGLGTGTLTPPQPSQAMQPMQAMQAMQQQPPPPIPCIVGFQPELPAGPPRTLPVMMGTSRGHRTHAHVHAHAHAQAHPYTHTRDAGLFEASPLSCSGGGGVLAGSVNQPHSGVLGCPGLTVKASLGDRLVRFPMPPSCSRSWPPRRSR